MDAEPVSVTVEDRAGLVARHAEQLGTPKKFPTACVLVLVHERPGHGYDLVLRLEAPGAERNPAAIYRYLRWLADAGLVSPTWVTSDRVGPARRVYSATPAATDALCDSMPALRQHARSHGGGLAKHVLRRLGALERPGQTFAFTASVAVRPSTANRGARSSSGSSPASAWSSPACAPWAGCRSPRPGRGRPGSARLARPDRPAGVATTGSRPARGQR